MNYHDGKINDNIFITVSKILT